MSAAGGSSESTDRAAPHLTTHVLGIAIFAITGMQLMSTLDGTIVIVALPRLQAELDLSDAGKSWVITAYVLTFGGLLLIGGRVGDAIGHKRAFLSGVGVFTIASLVCGLATDGVTLIVARAVQGTGAAIAAPTGLALIATTYAVGHARNRAFAVSAAMQASGSVLGLVLGGALTVVSWRLAFLINIPIGILIIWVAVTRLAETRHERLKLDVTGALLATLACTVGGAGVHAGPAARLDRPVGDRRGRRGGGVLRRVPARRAHRRAPDHSVLGVRQPQPRDDVRLAVHGGRRDADRDGDHRALRAGRDGVLGACGPVSLSCRSRGRSGWAPCWRRVPRRSSPRDG